MLGDASYPIYLELLMINISDLKRYFYTILLCLYMNIIIQIFKKGRKFRPFLNDEINRNN